MSMPRIRQLFNVAALFFICVILNACGKADYYTADGASGRFADLRGKWLFINYWAEWCKPCIKEMPELNNFQHQFNTSATVLGVNYDGASGDQLQQQIKKLQIEFGVLQQDPAIPLGYQRPDALPTTFVFNPQGKLTAMLVGPQSAETLAAAMTPPAPTTPTAP
jgi:thiol-disulfide isomerase/thioredoxin